MLSHDMGMGRVRAWEFVQNEGSWERKDLCVTEGGREGEREKGEREGGRE